VFLRNHDELTLEMVTEHDRQFMYEQYAPDPAMRKNVGIRRRLMPLINNDRSSFELLHGVLLSLPGSPFLYYGDEIGMGDDYELRDRDGVRTPMQWDDDPAGGFSTADPTSFYLPVISDPEYSPDVVNATAQMADPGSVLNWLRDLLALRKQYHLLADGDFALIDCGNEAVLSFSRSSSDAEILVLANFSGSSQTVSIDGTYTDLNTGSVLSGSVSLPGRGFVWLELTGLTG
jgi:maltose alpha-D-glucosyltransferase/alpha-amylase